MKKSWKIDPEKCTGCRTCEVVCSIQHHGELNISKSRMKVVKWEERGLDVPVVCQHCDTPVCLQNCPTGALQRNEETGGIVYRQEACIGCKLCLLVCPLGGINLDSDGNLLKCDLCGGDPQCVKFCIPAAIEYLPAEQVGERQRKKAAAAFLKDASADRK